MHILSSVRGTIGPNKTGRPRREARSKARRVTRKGNKGKGKEAVRLMSGQRQKNRPEQGVLAFPAESRSDAPKAVAQGTETLMAKHRTESLAGTERLMEEVCELENCKQALQRVNANKAGQWVAWPTDAVLP